MSGTRIVSFSIESEENDLKKSVVPLINDQVVESDYRDKNELINL